MIDPEIEEQIREEAKGPQPIKITYMPEKAVVKTIAGTVNKITSKEIFIDQQVIVLSSIVTYNGKIGPAYPDYEEYANACLNCADVGQF